MLTNYRPFPILNSCARFGVFVVFVLNVAAAWATGATVIVAASNSSEKSKQQADLVADGSGDQDEIYQAIHKLPEAGGTVLLMEGNFSINKIEGKRGGVIIDRSNVTLAGQGTSTKLVLAPNQNTNVIRIIGAGVGFITIRDLEVNQNRDQNPYGEGNPNISHDRFEYCGIKAFSGEPGQSPESVHDITIMNCTVLNSRRLGVMLDGPNMRVMNNVLGNAMSDAVEVLTGPGLITGNLVKITDYTHVGVGSDRGSSIIMSNNIVHVYKGAKLDIGYRSWANSERHVIADNILIADEGSTCGLAMDIRGFKTTATGNVLRNENAKPLPLWLTGADLLFANNHVENIQVVVDDQTKTNLPIVVKDNLFTSSTLKHVAGNLLTELPAPPVTKD